MNATFAYDPRKEVSTLRVGFGTANGSNPTRFALEARAAGIDFESHDQVEAFALATIRKEGIDMAARARDFEARWKPVEDEATRRFRDIFRTDWDPGDVTAYLTLSTRCPYSFKDRLYFVSVERETPVMISLHELIHFYTHQLIEPMFAEAGAQDRHNEFKEALSVLLNAEFADLLDAPDRGYPQHQELRARVLAGWSQSRDIAALASSFLSDRI